MTTALTYDQVMEKLPALVADCLAIDIEEVTPELVFCQDGDSIEILDLNFRCEKSFGIKSPFRLLLGLRDELTIDEAGFLTPAAIQLIRGSYPFFAAKFDADGRAELKPYELLQYFTVDMIVKFVMQASEQQTQNAQAA